MATGEVAQLARSITIRQQYLVFVAAAIGIGVYSYSRAQKYQQAFAAYKARRTRVRPQ